MSRSQFMALGDNPPKMASESSHSIFKSNWQTFSEKNHNYIQDESIPPSVFNLIEEYRDRAKSMKPGKDLALLIDDFFA